MKILTTSALILCWAAGAVSSLADEVAGIGAALAKEGDYLVVAKILPDSPAAVAGTIHEGDRIVAVGNGNDPAVPVLGATIEAAVGVIRGPKGTTVRLTIIPAGKADSDTRVVSFVRGELKLSYYVGDDDRLKPGTQAPNISWETLAGQKTEKLSDFAGTIVVLDFWATWCQPCQEVIANLQTYYEKHPDWKNRVVLISVSIDDDAGTALKHVTSKEWVRTHNVWVTSQAIKDFRVSGVPTTYVIDRQGRIVDSDPTEELAIVVDRLLDAK